jgi:hypothetical protein
MYNASGVKQHELCVCWRIKRVNKEIIMKTGKKHERKLIIVYRKDGKTPDMRYKSSREFVLSQHRENSKEQKKDRKTVDLKYTGLRDHVLLHQPAKLKDIPVQIKPAGKKPVWKVSS